MSLDMVRRLYEDFLLIIQALPPILLVPPIVLLGWVCYRFSLCRPSRNVQKTTSKDMPTSRSIQKAKDFGELCRIFGYTHEEHIATTEDGYMLGLHRLPSKKNQRRDVSGTSTGNPVVYLHHGLLTNSELFVCLTEAERSLPFVLVEHGYDVWLGNNRGNKYSQRHIRYSPKSSKFWDFSIDDFARRDIPDSLEFILKLTKAPKLSYVGFSQGTAQAFAALSMHPELNEKVNVFVALAPIMRPSGFATPVLDTVVKYFPSLIFRVFGRKSMLSSVAMWQSTLPPFILGKIIDTSLVFLFDYHSHNIAASQKVAAYPHIYCFSSVKAVAHWFQIMRNSSFHMYDENIISRVASTAGSNLERFPTQDIKAPMVLIYGDQDSLVDMPAMLDQLPDNIVPKRLHNYEHLDILWGKSVHEDVIPEVLDALERYSARE